MSKHKNNKNKPLWRSLSSKYLREQHDLMCSFDYRLTRWSKSQSPHVMKGHPIYEREGFDPFELSCTPRSQKAARKRLLDDLRKRHPEHQMWKSQRRGRIQRKVPKRRVATPVSLKVVPDPPARPSKPTEDAVPVCLGCGRRWLSDLDYSSRPCPQCGGEIRVERQAA